MATIHRLLLLLSSLLVAATLVGCSGGSTELPPERPTGTITGYAIDSAISGGIVSVYSFANGTRGERLGGGTTDSTGGFVIKLTAPSQIVLVEVTGGSYIEEASGTTVPLKDGEKLRSVVYYQLEQTVSTNVTPLTHMATALAENKITNGMAVPQAIEEAFNTIETFFDLDSRGTVSINITTETPAPVALGEEVLYGFLMAGMSSWTSHASRDNRVPPHTTYTSVGLAQIMYDDIRADGLLDGQGFNNDNTQLVPLAMGNVALNADQYRLAFSLHMLAMANNLTINKTGISVLELSAAADAIADQTTVLLGADQPLNISVRDIAIDLAEPKDGYYHGNFDFDLDVQGILGIDQISISILVDGSPEEAAIVGDPLIRPIQLDTTQYTDAQYTISVQVWNALGNTDTLEFTARFDNTGPQITLPPIAALTNVTEIPLSFTVNTDFAGLQSLDAIVNNATTPLNFADGQWHGILALSTGDNTVSIVASDVAGNQSAIDKSVYVDQMSPVIDTSAGHAEVQLSNGDGSATTGALADDNSLTAPLYLETNYAGFNTYGKVLSRDTLNSDNLPYFAFTVSDFRNTDVNTRAEDLTVRLQYQRSDTVLNDWHELPVQPQCVSTESSIITTCEYLIPLLSEVLDPPQDLISPWHESNPQQVHYLRIELNDGAGNVDTVDFAFKVDFYVPEITVAQPVDLGDNIFSPYSGSGFENRANLVENPIEFESTQYTVVNPANKPILLSLLDDEIHEVQQIVEEAVRENFVIEHTSEEWLIGMMNPEPDQIPLDWCPSVPTNLEPVTSVWNWNGISWETKSPSPDPIDSIQIQVYEDNPTRSPECCTDVPHFDDAFLSSGNIPYPPLTLNYKYDYLITGSSLKGFVTEWKLINANSTIMRECPVQHGLKQKLVFTYSPVNDYPRNNIVDQTLVNTPTFNTTGFNVYNETVGEILSSISGWYQIPAGHTITITKRVMMPSGINVHIDTAPVDYTLRTNDKSISWLVNRKLIINAIHDSGENNIGSMSQRESLSDTGIKMYSISGQ